MTDEGDLLSKAPEKVAARDRVGDNLAMESDSR